MQPVTLIGRRGDAVDSACELLEGSEVPVHRIDLDRAPVAGAVPREELEGSSPPGEEWICRYDDEIAPVGEPDRAAEAFGGSARP